ncbi:hypothetical protein E3P92_01690 [Wallemia ichthyophaga]|uniref:Uncharacterized protein n=2 Tax=Wallemia ichthyophaga TaxID=245174 RepID=A0A4T0JE85_WALIC|nr:uncharacterized protein J056_004557 [Wallemia ichthyophaga EXF-994]TIA68808.1 hypothetical protein E3P91_03914 [Wallemia ichthyophaga]EOR01236.1 hypothetical protein J056_004557 [Wallemia ichthyophaga EXF-994]TIA83281.1 hypothetical protein E3P98_00929 [Wallemia ichthyophaga]TIA87551.1 hypothetical protein E3P97_03899 [Wallemia ichthyophaga]TIA95110.1 hypothetical protein E3P95_03872 [Wallemia ichthyophaga]
MPPSTRGDVISEYVDGGSFSRNKLIASRESLFGGADGSPGSFPDKLPKSGLTATELKQLSNDDVNKIVSATGYSQSKAQLKLNQFKCVKDVILDYVKA